MAGSGKQIPGIWNHRARFACETAGLRLETLVAKFEALDMYSFEPTDEQKIMVDAARKLAAKEFRTRMSDADEKSEPAPEWMRAGWELGLLPASIPEAYGGFGEHSIVTSVLAAEELAWETCPPRWR